ncbi:UTP--glucose-1-phosphate uridylyltransferase domain-containing protein [Phthorimaea operculella]|nr:UTP--glucose-1-phosphate uridylyltransferase domain-containing protein [Phthorimaea operculella]
MHLNKTYKCNVPLVLMNSFNTDEDTQKVIRKYKGLKLDIHTFNQSCHPRINRESLLPIAKDANPQHDIEAWYPPGHGDFYESFYNSGLLQRFIKEGRTHCFISNIDNLGATVDLNILSLLLNPNSNSNTEFVMEVKWASSTIAAPVCFISNFDNLGATVDLNILSLLFNPNSNSNTEFVMERFIKEGRTHCFISNIDNLGATVDLNILSLLLNPNSNSNTEFVMKVSSSSKGQGPP